MKLDPGLSDLITVDPTGLDELEETLKLFKNKMSSGKDGLTTELLKYTTEI
jgi:hypothetical protein